jgi:two-component system response regulator FixJ
MKSEPTVYVVDADGHTRDAVRSLVYMMNLRCETYPSGQDFFDSFSAAQPGCVVLEVRIPDINGLEIQARLAAQGSLVPLVFLASPSTVSIAVRAMRAGALHFLEKPFREHELWDAIQEAVSLDRRRRTEFVQRQQLDGRLARLSAKERRLLEMIALGTPKKAMAAELGVCIRTIELRRNDLMRKLDVSSATDLVRFAVLACDPRVDDLADAQCA